MSLKCDIDDHELLPPGKCGIEYIRISSVVPALYKYKFCRSFLCISLLSSCFSIVTRFLCNCGTQYSTEQFS